MKCSVVIVTQNRKPHLENCLNRLVEQDLRPLEVIVVDNGSDAEAKNFLESFDVADDAFTLKKEFFSENTGLTFGRNHGAKQATGDILVWMDNDTYFEDTRALSIILKEFEADRALGILTYPVHEYLPGCHENYLIPRQHTSYKFEERFETSYFLGGANTMRTDMFSKYGMFDEALVYQLEELDFTYKIARDRIKIRYIPDIELAHRPPHVKFYSGNFYYHHIRNRIWIAMRYLPFPYLITHLSIWLSSLLLKSIKDFKAGSFFKGFFAGLRAMPENFRLRKKYKLSSETVDWLKQRQGRLWY